MYEIVSKKSKRQMKEKIGRNASKAEKISMNDRNTDLFDTDTIHFLFKVKFIPREREGIFGQNIYLGIKILS